MLIDIVGVVAGFLFAYSGIPVAIQCIKSGSAGHLPKQLMWCVFLGAILMLVYITVKLGFDWLVWIEYSITICVWGVVLFYRYFKTKPKT